MAMQNELRCRKHSVRTVPKISRPSMTIGTFDSDGKPFVSLYPFNLTRKWGVSNYFFLGGVGVVAPETRLERRCLKRKCLERGY
jgi:hypothetical protein